MNNLISVVIPVFNHAHTLERCLSSLVKQNIKLPMQLVLVNDGSTDNFAEVVNDLMSRFPAIKDLNPIIINQANLGASAARNRGFKEVLGEFVIFLDADTVCYPDLLLHMYQMLQSHPEANYAYSKFKFGWKTIKSHSFDVDLLKQINFVDVSSLIRTKDFPLFDETLKRFQDWDLWLTMLSQNKIGVFVPEVLYKKIVHGRKGISSWMPRLIYKLPWKTKSVIAYNNAKEIILKKHGLN